MDIPNQQNEISNEEVERRGARKKSRCRNSLMKAVQGAQDDKGKLADLESGLTFMSAYVQENQYNSPTPTLDQRKQNEHTPSRKALLGVIEGKSNSRLEAKLFSLLAEVDSSDDDLQLSSPLVSPRPTSPPNKESKQDPALGKKNTSSTTLRREPPALKAARPKPSTQVAVKVRSNPSPQPAARPTVHSATKDKDHSPVHRPKALSPQDLPSHEPRMKSTMDYNRLEGIARHQKAVEKRNRQKQALMEMEQAQRQFRARPLPASHRRKPAPGMNVAQTHDPPSEPTESRKYSTLGAYVNDQEIERHARQMPPIPTNKQLNSKSARETPALVVKHSLPRRPFSSSEHLQQSSSRLQLAGQGSLGSPVKSAAVLPNRAKKMTPGEGAVENQFELQGGALVEKLMEQQWNGLPPAGSISSGRSTARRLSAHSAMLARQKEYLERKRIREMEGRKKKEEEELNQLKKQPDNTRAKDSWEKAKMQNRLLRQRQEMEAKHKEQLLEAKLIAAKKAKQDEFKRRKQEELKRDRLRKRLAKRAAEATAARMAAEQTKGGGAGSLVQPQPNWGSGSAEPFGPKQLQNAGSVMAPSVGSWGGQTEAENVLFDDAINKLMDVEEDGRVEHPGKMAGLTNQMASVQMDGENRASVKKSYEDLEWERMYAEYKQKKEKEEQTQQASGFDSPDVGRSLGDMYAEILDATNGGGSSHDPLYASIASHSPQHHVGKVQDTQELICNTYGLPEMNITSRRSKSPGSKNSSHNHDRDGRGSFHTSRNDAAPAPYQKYENGMMEFFDKSSSADKGRFRVHDAKLFEPDSMHRKPDSATAQGGVTLLMGERIDHPGVEQVITVLFDRSIFSEEDAKVWWSYNRERFI